MFASRQLWVSCGATLTGFCHEAWLSPNLKSGRGHTLGGRLDVVAVSGEAAPAPQAHCTAPYRPRCSLDQRTAGQYLGGLGTLATECTCSAAEHPEGIKLRAY